MTAIPEITTSLAIEDSPQRIFLTNMQALWRQDPDLARQVDAIEDDQRPPLEKTRSGEFTTQLAPANGSTGDSSSPIYLHSRYDPVKEAQQLVSQLEQDEKYTTVVCGLGLGYHVRELLSRLRGDAMVVCIEPSLQVLSAALSTLDFSHAIRNGKIIFLTDPDKLRIHDRLQPFSTLMMLGLEFLHHPASKRIEGDALQVIVNAVKEFVAYTRMSILTLVTNSRITCKNIAMNLVTYLSTPPIDSLQNRFRGMPGIVVSAGPSLQKNIDTLARLKGKAVICAVQTSIKPLIQHGIEPDFITTLDFHEMSRGFYQNTGDLASSRLIAEPKATWHVLDDFPGQAALLHNEWAELILGPELGRRGSLKAGATVAHLAFYLARYMGCDPIIFVGQDLGYTGHVFYTPGVEIHQAWRSELNRFHTLEHKEWEKIVRNRQILKRVEANQGGTIYTDDLLLTYLEQFEKDVAESSTKVINATEGGARIRGMDIMSLADVEATYCHTPIPAERLAVDLSLDDQQCRKQLASGATELHNRLAELKDAMDVCNELLELLEELTSLTDSPTEFNRRLVRVDELRVRITNESRTYMLINAACQLAELRRFSADRRIRAVEHDEIERAKRQIERDIEFIKSVKQGAEDVSEILRDALERIENR